MFANFVPLDLCQHSSPVRRNRTKSLQLTVYGEQPGLVHGACAFFLPAKLVFLAFKKPAKLSQIWIGARSILIHLLDWDATLQRGFRGMNIAHLAGLLPTRLQAR